MFAKQIFANVTSFVKFGKILSREYFHALRIAKEDVGYHEYTFTSILASSHC